MTRRQPCPGYDQAIAEGDRALALDPNNADSYTLQAQALLFAGRPEEALRMMQQAMRLNPHYPPWYLFELGTAYQLTGRYTESVATLKESINGVPIFCIPTSIWLSATYGNGPLNSAPLSRRWSRQWQRYNGPWPSLTS